MNYVDYSAPLVFIQNFTLVTLKVNAIQYIGFGKLKYFNFKTREDDTVCGSISIK